MKYDVHIYPIMRVKVCSIEADSQCEAIEKACEQADFTNPEEAEEISHFLVDEVGDPEHHRSRWHDGVDCSVMKGGKDKRDEFIELIARMTIDDEHDEEDSEALHNLIEKAREITGLTEPEDEEHIVTDEERSNGPGKRGAA